MLSKYFIGIDIGGTKIVAGIVSPSGEIVRSLKIATPAQGRSVEVLAALHNIVKSLLKEAALPLKDLLGIGVAVPGVVDPAGKVVVTPNIRLSGVELKQILVNRYKTRVAVGNDVNLGVLGEHWLGAARKSRHVVGIFPGTGVGGGVIVDGRFLAGSQGAGAELGHMMVDPHGPQCTCGNIGCLEAFAGRWAMERDIRAAIKKGEASLITEIAGRDLKQIKSGALKTALEAKDPLVTRIFHDMAEAIGRACVSLNHIFNPEMFLFGGGVIEACGDTILPVVERHLKKDPFFAKLTPPKVMASKLGDDAVMLGAVAAVRQECDARELLDTSYYPKLQLMGAGKVQVNGKLYGNTLYIRADGKIKEPFDIIPSRLTDKDLEEICKKGPDLFLVAVAKGRKAGFSPKALKFLCKKNILPKPMELSAAVKTYNTTDERRAILFYF